jgi:dihydroorotase
MITLLNVQRPDGVKGDHRIQSPLEREIDAEGLILFPGLIDPHVHFRTPGLEHKEDWRCAAQAALAGGITTVFDMPNTLPPTTTKQRLDEKKTLIDAHLKEVGIPLRYALYLGAHKMHFEEIAPSKDEAIGLKVFMGSSTGDLLLDDEESLQKAFHLSASHNLVLAIHAEDEALIKKQKIHFQGNLNPEMHSHIRSREAAYRATETAISLAKRFGTRLYLLHIGTKEELSLIEAAKKEGLSIYAETTPHHLFLTERDYAQWGTKVQTNPPLRTAEDNEALWRAIAEGVIDTIGSDHAPHTSDEKNLPYGRAPSGIPGIETMLPLLLNSGRLTYGEIIRLMKTNIETIFEIPPNDDCVLIDPNRIRCVEDHRLKTKCGWSPYAGQQLKGWPVMTILKGEIFYA